MRVLGSAGAYVVDALDGQEDRLRETGALPVGGLAVPPEAFGRLLRGDEGGPVASEPGRWDLFYPAVLSALLGDGDVPVDPADAVRTLELIEAARVSAAEHRVVDL